MLLIQRSILLGGAALLSLPTIAGAPSPFDQWSVGNGTVAASCGSGFSCAVLTTGPGFMQQQLTDPVTKLSYIKTIVTDPQSTGVPQAAGLPFSTENYVRTGNFDPTQGSSTPPSSNPGTQTTPNGIASQQRLHAESSTATTTGVFDTVVLINSGWAATAGTPSIDITQTVGETRSDGTTFSDTARIRGNNDSNGLQIGTSIFLDSTFTQPRSDGSTGKDIQSFALRRVGGNMLATTGSGTLGSSSVSWGPGDVIQTVWMGQQMDFGSGAGGFGGWGGGSTSSGVFGFQSYDNLSDAVAQISTSSTSSAAPVSWVDPPFGPQPVMPAGGDITGGGGDSGGWGGGGWGR